MGSVGAFWLIFGLEKAIFEKNLRKIKFLSINLHFDLLDHEVDILSTFLSPKSRM